jgi:hypothetical protein
MAALISLLPPIKQSSALSNIVPEQSLSSGGISGTASSILDGTASSFTGCLDFCSSSASLIHFSFSALNSASRTAFSSSSLRASSCLLLFSAAS